MMTTMNAAESGPHVFATMPHALAIFCIRIGPDGLPSSAASLTFDEAADVANASIDISW